MKEQTIKRLIIALSIFALTGLAMCMTRSPWWIFFSIFGLIDFDKPSNKEPKESREDGNN